MPINSPLNGCSDFCNYYATLASENYADVGKFFDGLFFKSMPILRFNPSNQDVLRRIWEKKFSWKTLDWYPYALKWPDGAVSGTKLPGFREHLIYAMNPSSLLPVLAMNLSGNEIVLDAAAAPGGKALMIADIVFASEGHLVVNDISKARLNRMMQVFDDYGYEKYVEYINLPAETIFMDAFQVFDVVLLDAPCSSEAHVVEDDAMIDKWSTKRIKKLRSKQYRMIDSLLKTLKVGGRLIYSTCAITAEENEAVIAKILKNRGDIARLVSFNWSGLPGSSGIPGRYDIDFDLSAVRRIWPDEVYDPMFVAVLEKIA